VTMATTRSPGSLAESTAPLSTSQCCVAPASEVVSLYCHVMYVSGTRCCLTAACISGMANVVPTAEEEGPFMAWSVAVPIRQAQVQISSRSDTETRTVQVTSLTTAEMPKCRLEAEDEPFFDDTTGFEGEHHRVSQAFSPASIYLSVGVERHPVHLTKLKFGSDEQMRTQLVCRIKKLKTGSERTQTVEGVEGLEGFALAVDSAVAPIPPQSESSPWSSCKSSKCNIKYEMQDIGTGGPHEIVVVQNLIPVVDMHSIFDNPQASASWLANDILILCACKDQAMFGCLVLIIEVTCPHTPRSLQLLPAGVVLADARASAVLATVPAVVMLAVTDAPNPSRVYQTGHQACFVGTRAQAHAEVLIPPLGGVARASMCMHVYTSIHTHAIHRHVHTLVMFRLKLSVYIQWRKRQECVARNRVAQ